MQERVNFQAVKEAVSREEVLRYYQVPGLRRHREQRPGRCPLHAGTRDDSFRARLTQNVFHCFAGPARGSVLDFVAAREKGSLREAALRLQEWFRVPERAASPPRAKTSAVPTVRFGNKKGDNPPLPFALTGVDHAHPYLRQRGMERSTAVEFGLGYYPGPGLMSGRLVIPIPHERGAIVAYAGRALDGRPPKYKLPPGFRKGQELFNQHRAAATGDPTVIVVEGYFDCLRVHQAGFPCGVALMGSSLSPEPKRILLERFERVVLLLDGDAVGRAASRAIRTELAKRCRVAEVHVPEGQQPDQLSATALENLLFKVTPTDRETSCAKTKPQLIYGVGGVQISGIGGSQSGGKKSKKPDGVGGSG